MAHIFNVTLHKDREKTFIHRLFTEHHALLLPEIVILSFHSFTVSNLSYIHFITNRNQGGNHYKALMNIMNFLQN